MPWWFEENGTLLLQLSFGERTMIIPGKNPVIRVGKRSNLLTTLEALHILVDDRQMDDVIEKMVVVSRSRHLRIFRGCNGAAAPRAGPTENLHPHRARSE